MSYPLERNLTNHPPRDDATVEKMEEIRLNAKDLAFVIDLEAPDSREKSLAFMHLEQTVMWAIASLARDGH